jgi:hypothetical protein
MTSERASVEPDQHGVPEREPAADLPVPRQAQTYPLQDRGRAVAGTPGRTGAGAGQHAAPVRSRDQVPAGGTPASTVREADSVPPDRPEPLSGDEWRKAAKRAQSAAGAERRRRAGKYTRVADRTAGSQYRPGMSVRKPPAGGET